MSEFDPANFKTQNEWFEHVIQKFGVVNACEWFGHASDSEFTRDTLDHFKHKKEGAPEKAQETPR